MGFNQRPLSLLISLKPLACAAPPAAAQAPRWGGRQLASGGVGRRAAGAAWCWLHSATAPASLRRQQTAVPRPGRRRARRWARGCLAVVAVSGRDQNREVLVGDCLCLVCFAIYKQIMALTLLPTFPGWLAPLAFNPTRFLELLSFAMTLVGTWVGCGWLVGGFSYDATADLQTAVARVCRMWLAAMPVAAAQLVLLTAAEDGSLVGTEGVLHPWASVLPLAASGPGEPFVTAGGVLGLLSIWRAFYCSFLDFYSFRTPTGARVDRSRDAAHFVSALRAAATLSAVFCLLLWGLDAVGEDRLELLASQLHL